jgi:mannosyltransferase OCH1-like enzyme
MGNIPRVLHFVWIGDERRRPDNCIDTWRTLNPGFRVRVWGNREYVRTRWVNRAHMEEMRRQELCGVADMMRYEILVRHGGVALDADSVCVRPLEDWLLEPAEFACWENEHVRPGLIAAGCLGSVPGSPFFRAVIADIRKDKSVTRDRAWRTVGPGRLTRVWTKTRSSMTVYPSHYFYPAHLTGLRYAGRGPVFAEQLWASTYGHYDLVHRADLSPLIRRHRRRRPRPGSA